MKHEPYDFEAHTRQAKIKEWLGTMRGPGKRRPQQMQLGEMVWMIGDDGIATGFCARIHHPSTP